MRYIKKLGVLSLVLTMYGYIMAAGGVGSTAASFLKIGLGARPSGMAYAFSAVSDDINAIWWNPAGLAQLQRSEVAATYLKYFQDINYGFVAYAGPSFLDDKGRWAVSFSYLSVTGIEKRAGDTDTPDSTFNSSDINGIISYAYPDLLGEGLDAGVNLKIFNEAIDDKSALSFALDIGFMYKFSGLEDLKIAVVLQNLGTGLKFVDVSDPLPLTAKFGLSYRVIDGLLVASDFEYGINDEKWYAQFGAEYWLVNMFALRAGYRLNTDLGSTSGLSVGAGFKLDEPAIGLDYAFIPYGDLGSTHRISLSYKF